MSKKIVRKWKKVAIDHGTRHVCDRCGTKSTVIHARYMGILPQGWSHLRYVDPTPLADDIEMDFCTPCSVEIMHHK